MEFALVDFAGEMADHLTAEIEGMGGRLSGWNEDAPFAAKAVFVCGDRPGWLARLTELRARHPRAFLVAVTRLPDHEKWLDALEAGANDYFCLPLDQTQLKWLVHQRDADSRVAAA